MREIIETSNITDAIHVSTISKITKMLPNKLKWRTRTNQKKRERQDALQGKYNITDQDRKDKYISQNGEKIRLKSRRHYYSCKTTSQALKNKRPFNYKNNAANIRSGELKTFFWMPSPYLCVIKFAQHRSLSNSVGEVQN